MAKNLFLRHIQFRHSLYKKRIPFLPKLLYWFDRIVFSTEIWSLLDFLILDPRKFNRFSIENGNIVWGKNWDLMFPIEQLHDGVLL